MDPFIGPAFSSYYQEFPLVLVDVGASRGLPSHWKCAEKYLHVIGFEPDHRSFVELEKSRRSASVVYLNVGLDREKGTREFYMTRTPTDSSMLKPNRTLLERFPDADRFDIVGKITIETDTLDNQLQERKITDVDFIKVDTQGSELLILEGATEILRNAVFGLEIEVEFIQMYQNQPLFADVDNFVRACGFQLFDLRPVYWKREAGKNYGKAKGQIVFADVLYLRGLEGFQKILDRTQDAAEKKSKVLRALSICIIYGYLDYALEVIHTMRSLFSKRESQWVCKRIERMVLSWMKIPNFRGRARIANALHACSKVLQPQGWRTIGSGKVLGNFE